MDEEQRKGRRRTRLDQLQEERSSNLELMETTESDEADDTSTDDDDEDFECSDGEFFDAGGLQFGQDLSEDDELDDYEFQQDMEEDDVDPDQLSYEELLALGDMIGVENKGISEDEITKHLHPLTFHSTSNLLIDKCVICQVEYEEKEVVVSLQCHHSYHKDCIVKWLQINKACPICNNDVSSLGFAMEKTEHVNK